MVRFVKFVINPIIVLAGFVVFFLDCKKETDMIMLFMEGFFLAVLVLLCCVYIVEELDLMMTKKILGYDPRGVRFDEDRRVEKEGDRSDLLDLPLVSDRQRVDILPEECQSNHRWLRGGKPNGM